ncbi:MAG TPA: PAS domain S-box protein [bacterium]|jgi:PAS domain S-box-containing protein
MVKRDVSAPHSGKSTKLRQVAEDILKTRGKDSADSAPLMPDDVQRIAHELHVHQVELEAQNEELRRSQLELQMAYAKLADMFDFAPVGYFTLDQKGTILEANLTAALLLGMDRSKLIGRPFTRFIAPESLDAFYLYRRNALAARARHTLVAAMVKATGVPFVANLDSISAPDTSGKAPMLRVTLSDITPLADAERALRVSEEKYRTLIHNVPVVTWTRDSQGVFVFISPNIESVCGFTPEEVLGTDMRFWKRQVHPEDTPRVIHSFMQMLSKGEAADVEYRFRHKRGDWIWLQGRALRRIEESNSVRVDGILIDISERKRAEEQAKEAQRRQAFLEKQAALGQIAAAVAHEINNPLGGIQNAFLLLKKAVPPDHPNAMFVGLVEREIRRMAEIVRQMTMLYRPSAGKRCECDAVTAVKETLQILSSDSRSHGITFRFVTELPELAVRMGEGELRQVIYNLVINALQVSSPGKDIEIGFEHNGDVGRISVTDHGEGIPEDVLPHIFEPFYSRVKRGDQSSMGLGLSVSRSLVEGVGGAIEIQTKPGEGTTFTLVLSCPAK